MIPDFRHESIDRNPGSLFACSSRTSGTSMKHLTLESWYYSRHLVVPTVDTLLEVAGRKEPAALPKAIAAEKERIASTVIVSEELDLLEDEDNWYAGRPELGV